LASKLQISYSQESNHLLHTRTHSGFHFGAIISRNCCHNNFRVVVIGNRHLTPSGVIPNRKFQQFSTKTGIDEQDNAAGFEL